MTRRPYVTAVVLAGGSGERMEARLPKQFLELAGRPLLAHSIRTLESCDYVASVVVVLPENRPSFIEEALRSQKIASVATGGTSRQASLGEGLMCLPEETEVVLVHDAARPLVTTSLIERVSAGFEGGYSGVVCAVPMEDAIKDVSFAGEVVGTPRREGLWRAQTPQAFLRSPLENALARADAEGVLCDDCSELATRAGYRVRVVMGDPWNIKVTYERDLTLCESIIAARPEES